MSILFQTHSLRIIGAYILEASTYTHMYVWKVKLTDRKLLSTRMETRIIVKNRIIATLTA